MAATPDAAVEAAGGIPGEFLPYHPDRLDVYLARQTRLGSPAYLAVILLLASSAAALPVVAVPVSVTGRGFIRSAIDSQTLVAPVGGEVVYAVSRAHRRVAAGDTLLRLERTDLAARESALSGRAETMEQEARDLEQMIAWAGADHVRVSPASLRYRAELASTVQELSAAAARIRSAEREAARAEALYERRLVPAADAAALRDRTVQEREDSLLLRSRAAARWRGELAALHETMRSLSAERVALWAQLDQLVVQSPVAGWLDRVASLSPGSRLLPGERFATLTPDARLIAELYVDPRAVDAIRPGARVRLQLQSRQYSRSGAFDGVVVEISPMLVQAGEGAVAIVRVAQEPAFGESGAALLPLRRGSAVVGRLPLGKRTLWALLRASRDPVDGRMPAPPVADPQAGG